MRLSNRRRKGPLRGLILETNGRNASVTSNQRKNRVLRWRLIAADLFHPRRRASHASTRSWELALNRNNGPFSSPRGGAATRGTGRRRKSWKRWRGRELGRAREKRSACDRDWERPPPVCSSVCFFARPSHTHTHTQTLIFHRETQRTNDSTNHRECHEMKSK